MGFQSLTTSNEYKELLSFSRMLTGSSPNVAECRRLSTRLWMLTLSFEYGSSSIWTENAATQRPTMTWVLCFYDFMWVEKHGGFANKTCFRINPLYVAERTYFLMSIAWHNQKSNPVGTCFRTQECVFQLKYPQIVLSYPAHSITEKQL